MTHATTEPARTADHWWWRPGWQLGTRFYTIHVTFQDVPSLHAHAAAWREVLVPFGNLDLVPDPWLHLTMQGLGKQGVVAEKDVDAIGEAAAARVGALDVFEIEVDAPSFTPEAVRFDPVPTTPVTRLRDAVRAAIGDVWPEVPERADGFEPHVTIAYGNRDADASPILAAVAAADIPPIRIPVAHADLLVLGRDEGMYTWTVSRTLPLGV